MSWPNRLIHGAPFMSPNKSLQRSGGQWYLVCKQLAVIDKVPIISLGEPPGAELSRWAAARQETSVQDRSGGVHAMTKRLCFAAVLALIAPAPTNAQSNAVVLSCQYDATVDRSNPAAIGVVPGVVEISQDLASARLDGVQVSAEKVGEVVLTFSMKDWVYSLNRVTGELTFHSPKGLERWSRLRLQTLQSAALRGIDVAKAELELQELHKKSFDMQQHSASCRPVEKRLF